METPDEAMFGRAGLAERIHAASYGAVGSLPRTLRTWAAVVCHAANLQRLTAAMTHWTRGRHLDRDRFAALFLGRDADDPVVELLRSALPGVDQATSHAQLGEAAAKIAAAIQAIGPDRWTLFLIELENRALDPATRAAIECGAPPIETASEADPGDITQMPRDSETVVAHQESDPQAGPPMHTPPRIAAGPGGHPRPWGLPSPGTVPPVRNPTRLKPGRGSQPSLAAAAGHSLWDDHGGEWQYHPDDAWHNPHWDYNEHTDTTTPWRSIPINDQSPWK